jgi:phosphoglycerol transferase MdoB-like AlkP superfamily enzyme
MNLVKKVKAFTTMLYHSRYRVLLILAASYLILSILLRMVLWWQFSPEHKPLLHIPLLISIGLLYDLIQLVYLLLPITLLWLILPNRLFQHQFGKFILAVTVFLALYGMLFLSEVEFYFFEEFNARFNLVAVDYLRYPHEVLINIWESYPISTLLAFNAALTLLLLYPLRALIYSHHDQILPFKQRLIVIGSQLFLTILITFLFSAHSFKFSEDRVINEIATNGVSSFFQALRTNQLDYSVYYPTLKSNTSYQLLAEELAKGGGEFTQLAQKNLQRRFTANIQGLGKLNVMIIVEESFGAEFVGSYGDQRHLTPYFDELAQQGMLFTHAWATGTRTVRGLEAITLSFPPIPSESIIKRLGNENMANWGQVMQKLGYHTSFLYGGYGYFDNMNYFYQHNGFAVSDRTDMPSPKFANIWGVSDEDLLFHAMHYYDRLHDQRQPFFSIVMTTSNHKPFTFPEGIAGIPSQGGDREAGIRYADYAIGQFFKKAPSHGWFDNTLFIIIADHGARVYGQAEIPLSSYEIPLLIYSPSHITPSKINRAISQMDLAPTVLSLLGLPYEAPFFGQNIFNLPTTQPTVLLFNHNYTVALVKGDELAILNPQQTGSSEHYDANHHKFTPLLPNQSQIDLAIAYYQIAFEQFIHHLYQ